MRDIPPFRENPIDRNGLFSKSWVLWLQNQGLYASSVSNHGTTANRPTKSLFIGMPYLDETLGKPIWLKTVSPIVWIDATGASV